LQEREQGFFSNDQKEIGHVTSGGFGPSVNGPIAMGYVDYDQSKEGTKVILKVREKYGARSC
jgi:aminomethyltransferase